MSNTVNAQKNISDYVDWMGISNVRISEKTGIPAQKVGRQLALKQKMSSEDVLKYCEALEKEPNFFFEWSRQEAQHDQSEIQKTACGETT